MYSVYAKKGNNIVCIYNDKYRAPETLSLSPKLELVESAAGSLKIKLPPDNNGYSFIDRLTTEIIVYREDVEIWSGRVISEETDFWNNRVLECEGELAYLNDTIQPQAEYHNITPRNLLTTFINIHNANAPADKRFTVGAVTVEDPNDSLYRYTNYESTLEAINDKLVERLGGYLYIRKENGTRYLDYLSTHPNTVSQPIRFGVNLLDFTKSFDSTDFCTVVLPLGCRLEDDQRTSTIEALEEYLTVKSVNNNDPYVKNTTAYNTFGWIAKVVHWDNVTSPSILKSKAQTYLSEVQFDTMELEVQAVDLNYTDDQIESIGISDQVRVISEPHGLDRYFPITKMSIPLDDPADTAFTIGTSVKMGFTERSNQANNAILEKIESLPTEAEILTNAKENADQIINSFTNGYITITKNNNGSNELYVSDVQYKNPEEIQTKSNRYWRWNLNGLGYYDKNNPNGRGNPNYTGGGLRLALTMDGRIVADYITVGTMTANRIRGGTLGLGGSDQGDYKNGSLYIYNSSNTEIGHWNRSGIEIKTGSIKLTKTAYTDTNNGVYLGAEGLSLGPNNTFKVSNTGVVTITGGSINIHNNDNSKTFSVTTDGYLSAKGANITGAITATSGSFSGSITSTSGKIGNFTIDSNSIRTGEKTSTADGSVCLGSANFTRSLNGANRTNLRFAIGSKFGVTADGTVYATSGVFKGTLTSTDASIGNFTIDANTIRTGDKTSTSNGAVCIASSNFTRSLNGANRTNLRLAIGSKFGVTDDGTVYATSGVFKGTLTSTDASIGNFTIDANTIRTGDKTSTSNGAVCIASSNFTRSLNGANITNLRFAIGSKFGVADDGYLYATGGVFKGDITGASGTFSGSLSGASISGGSISGTTITGGSISGSTITSNAPSGGTSVSINGGLIEVNVSGSEAQGNHQYLTIKENGYTLRIGAENVSREGNGGPYLQKNWGDILS